MTKATITGGPAATALAVLSLVAGCGPVERDLDDADAMSTAATSTGTVSGTAAAGAAHPSLLNGRITTVEGVIYEGRLRFGGEEEAFWGDYFNGVKADNPWVAHLLPDRLPEERHEIALPGLETGLPGAPVDLRRPFMARFGDISKLEARGRDLRATLKSGTVVHLDRWAADDFADGVRVWDARGVVDLGERQIRTIEFLPPVRPSADAPDRLHGTVHSSGGAFTGFLRWERKGSVGSDELEGHADAGEPIEVPFARILSIARLSPESARVTLLDGRRLVLSDTRDVGRGHRGIYVDDPRYGRVLISWDAFHRVEFSAAGTGPDGSGPGYVDFPIGRPLTGTVTTRTGHHLTGRLVYDLDESEITETLDAPSGGVDYTIPFGLVASVAPPGDEERASERVKVTLRSGEELRLEPAGDLGDGNAGMLIFIDGGAHPEYVPWAEVARIDFDRPRAMYPSIGRQ